MLTRFIENDEVFLGKLSFLNAGTPLQKHQINIALENLTVRSALHNGVISLDTLSVLSDSSLPTLGFFKSEDGCVKERIELFMYLTKPHVICALRDGHLPVDQIFNLAKKDMQKTNLLLNYLLLEPPMDMEYAEREKAMANNSSPPAPGLNYILEGKITFDIIYQIAEKHGAKLTAIFIKQLNHQLSPWFKKNNLQPNDILNIAYEADNLSNLVDTMSGEKLEQLIVERKERLTNENKGLRK